MLIRKLLVIGLVASIFAVSCIWSIARFLSDSGAVEAAEWLRREHFTGTALTVIAAMLVLLPGGRRGREWPFD